MRFEDWPARLSTTIDAARKRSFAYGAFDCALFAADCVHAMTGIDYAEQWRGYDSRISAYRIVAGYGSLEGMITELLAREPVHPSFARRGDVVLASIDLAPGESGECIGIHDGVKSWFPQEPAGLRAHPTLRARLAWRID